MERIRGVIRNYDWGDNNAIADLLGNTPTGEPEAEYWLGAHISAPSVVVRVHGGDGSEVQPLDRYIAERPSHVIGEVVAARFDQLPFLLKVLAADRPLSIQAHPSLEQAIAGFAAEESAGIGLAARDRSYRDENHKPELICALTPFDAKCGFRPVAESLEILAALDTSALGPVTDLLGTDEPEDRVLAEAIGWLLRLPGAEAAALADAVRDAAIARGAAGDVDGPKGTTKNDGPFAIEFEWIVRIAEMFPGDIGAVVGLLLNHVSLKPGQAIFLQAGNLHSYLRGVGIELMANSDNVLRGGLTSKHIDVDQLLDIVDYRPSVAPVQTPSGPVHRFRSPVPEFSLTRLDSTVDGIGSPSFEPVGPEIVLVTSGAVSLSCQEESFDVRGGGAVFINYGDGRYHVSDLAPGETVAWRASVGSELEV